MGFNEILARLRRERGLNQEELAAKLGVSRQAVSKWETGEASPDLGNLLALADALDVSLDALCGRETAEDCAANAAASVETSAPPKERNWRRIVLILVAVLLGIRLLLVLAALLSFLPPDQISGGETETVLIEEAVAGEAG